MTVRNERKADSIARAIVRSLERLERFEDDPEMVLDSAKRYLKTHKCSKGTCMAFQAILGYYNDSEERRTKCRENL